MARPSILAVLAVELIAAGCSTTTVRLRVLRPAAFNAQAYGGTMTVGEFRCPSDEWNCTGSAERVRQVLRERIVAAPGSPVRYLEQGGGVVIAGAVTAYSYRETASSHAATCGSGRNAYPCTRTTHRGQASAGIAFNLIDARTTETLGTTSMSRQTSDSADAAQRSRLDGPRMLQVLLEGMAGEFARLIVPWYDEVSVVFRDCDGPAEAPCAAGVAAVEAGNYDLAIQHFDAAVAAGRALAADEQAKIHWNRGLALEYGGQYAEAIAALGEARRLDPGEADYAREMENVQRMKTNADQLLEQGVGQAPAPEGAEPGVSP